ncbi:competence type IV pilus minor pilin ComGF [Ruoffia tabacinasalis]|uniref:competence type IV pilus minor pilin ComGF n=1 Tax=Ruoffia tabacinasalis TaxID=87458 RepID=UPI0030D5B3D7
MSKFKTSTFKKGFTLLEVIISLFVLSLFMHSLMTIYNSYNTIETEIRTDRSADFLHFMTLLELELEKYTVTGVDSNIIRIESTETKRSSRIINQNYKIYIAPGHQPLLYDVYSWQVFQVANKVSVTVTFNNGQVFSGFISVKLNS